MLRPKHVVMILLSVIIMFGLNPDNGMFVDILIGFAVATAFTIHEACVRQEMEQEIIAAVMAKVKGDA